MKSEPAAGESVTVTGVAKAVQARMGGAGGVDHTPGTTPARS